MEHYYLHTKPIDGLDPMSPVVRDLDGYIYFRENKGRILAGGFEPVAKPAFENGIIPGQSLEVELKNIQFAFYIFFISKRFSDSRHCRGKVSS